MEWINKYGSLFSLIGLALTLLTFIGVLLNKGVLKKLNRKNFRVNRMPENLKDLKAISDRITDLLLDFNSNKKDIKSELSKVQPTLKSLQKSLEKADKENFNSLKSSLKDIDNWTFEGAELKWYHKFFGTKKEMTESMVNEVDIKLTRLITDVENIGKDNTKNLI